VGNNVIDGLYISSYFDIGPLKNILDVRQRHDHGVALWQLESGQLNLRRYWEFERISGQKQHPRALHDIVSAKRLVGALLSEEGADLGDIVEIWGTPGLETSKNYQGVFDPAYAFHGMAHLMTALFYQVSDPQDSPIVAMSLDAAPDTLFEPDARARHYYPGCVIDDDGMRLFSCESPGRLWAYATTKYRLREGTLMALASASDAEVRFDVSTFDHLGFRGMETRSSAPHVVESVAAYVANIASRDRWLVPPGDSRLSALEHQISATMKVVSQLSLRIVKRNLQQAERDCGADLSRSRLALAGGFALNCPTNSQLIRDFSFDGYQIPPCASDSGIALGTGLAAFFPILQRGEASVRLASPYFGQDLGDLDSELNLVESHIENVQEISPEEVALLIVSEGMVAWVNGYAEIGPRALGNRSLLADPRSTQVRDRLNLVKKRQWWRPVAPVVLDEEGDRYFEHYLFSPFMALNFQSTGLARREIPGVLHIDGTARVQSVTSETNPALSRLIIAFKRNTGVPVLSNTSLNDAGEPIINRLSEAVHFAAGKGIKSLIVNSTKLIRLRDSRASYYGPLARAQEYFGPPPNIDQEEFLKRENPYNLSRQELAYFFDNSDLFRGTDPRATEDAAVIRERTSAYIAKYPGSLDRAKW
jgi:carbamoyltransferase